MIPILSSTTTLTGNGLGRLSDALSCLVTHEINGMYELVMRYPVTGNSFSELANDRIIWADTDSYTQQQGFRIYRITRPLNGIVTVYARHLCYDMSGYVCPPYSKTSLTTALASLAASCVPSGCTFTFTSPRTVATAYKTSVPMSLWQMMGGVAGSLLDVYGGEWDFNNYTATLRTSLGSDRGMSIRYSKNMTALEQDASIEAQYGGIFPYWYNSETGTLVTLPENYITVAGGGSRVLCIDFSDEFQDAPTEAQLRNRATTYATANKVGEVAIQWKVEFVPLQKSEEYKNAAALESVQLGDTVHVYYEPMNLNATARAVKTEYNVLLDRFETVTLGRVKQNLAKIVTQQKREIDHTIGLVKSTLEHAIDEATDFITNGAGYMRFIYDSNDNLTEIVSLDNPDINNATNVWRWNNGGFGFSANGYGGPYTTAITQNGAIVADFITAGTLNANIIRAGILQDANGQFSLDLATGTATLKNAQLSGVFEQTVTKTYDHTQYSSTDLTRIQNIITGSVTPTSADYTKFDINMDGVISGYDLTAVLDMINTSQDETATIKTTIDPSTVAGSIAVVQTIDNIATSSVMGGSRISSPNIMTPNKCIVISESGTGDSTLRLYHGGGNPDKAKEIVYIGQAVYNSNGGGVHIEYNSSVRAALEMDGLVFYNSGNNETGRYPNTGLGVFDLNDNLAQLNQTSGTARTYKLTQGTYLLSVVRYNSTSTAYDGLWLVQAHATSSHLVQIIKGSSALSPSISALTLSLTTTSANQRVTITRLG